MARLKGFGRETRPHFIYGPFKAALVVYQRKSGKSRDTAFTFSVFLRFAQKRRVLRPVAARVDAAGADGGDRLLPPAGWTPVGHSIPGNQRPPRRSSFIVLRPRVPKFSSW